MSPAWGAGYPAALNRNPIRPIQPMPRHITLAGSLGSLDRQMFADPP